MTTLQPGPLDGNLLLLRQGLDLLAQLTDEEYRVPTPGHSAVGAQYRHILDHYRCLLAGLDGGLVDYDARERSGTIERERPEAVEATRTVLDRLACLAPAELAVSLRVSLATSADQRPEDPQHSTLGRELLFVLSHTVHHYAIIRLLLEFRGVACDAGFGVAPSTLAYERSAG